MIKKVRALYDFDAQPDSGELSISVGEVLTVTRTDVGEGWWEGHNSKGETGLFPEAYVEDAGDSEEEGPPPMAPPPLPPDYSGESDKALGWVNPAATVSKALPKQESADGTDDWGNSGWGYANTNPSASGNNGGGSDPWDYQAGSQSNDPSSARAITGNVASAAATGTNQGYDQDEWDSDFDDEDQRAMPPPSSSLGTTRLAGPSTLAIPKNSLQSGSAGDISSMGKNDGKKPVVAGRTSFNRFSTFVKSGGESFVLGKLNSNVQETDIITVVDQGDGRYCWLNSQAPYSVAVASPKKESKLKGLKSYIAYQLTPSFNGIQVPRRYKHFDWLHERLVEKFTMIPVPPLPDKQIQGRYEDEFIEHRMIQLQSFVDRVCRHPILSQSEVWLHFLTCTDDKKWKNGKRKAEKDALVGGNLFMAIRRPEKPLDVGMVDHQMEVFTKFTSQFDGAVKNMQATAADQTAKCQKHYKREFLNIGKAFIQLGQALQQDGNMQSTSLTNAVTCTGEAYEEIAKMYEDQPKNDWEPLGDTMYDYRGILSGWPGIMQIHSGAVAKRKDFDRLATESKINSNELDEIASRTDTLSYSIMAEINTFHQTKAQDLKQANQRFLQEQIAFYQKVVEKLQDALRMYDSF